MTRRSQLPLPDPIGETHASYLDRCVAAGVARPRAIDAYHRFFRDGEGFPDRVPAPTRVETTPSDEGDVHKFLMPIEARGERGALRVLGQRGESLETESVVIPMWQPTGTINTLCVSSQVGCAMGCVFCETAQMGLLRSLSPDEIVAQWWAATHRLGHSIRNIVFMGMGEPLDNAPSVLRAIEILTDHHGPNVAMRRITVSTVGRLDGLELLRSAVERPGWRQLNLAVSVNAPNDEIRSRIMPINRAMPLSELVAALRAWPLRKSGFICCEYVLIPGVNDADELAALLEPVRCCINVIPYNPRRDSPWPAPSETSVDRFLARLSAHGRYCTRRRTKGRDTMAACGQLGNERIRGRKLVAIP